jgi:hypothetical protein
VEQGDAYNTNFFSKFIVGKEAEKAGYRLKK